MERGSCDDRMKPPPTTGQFSAAVDRPLCWVTEPAALSPARKSRRPTDPDVEGLGTSCRTVLA
jgi:hypothetical protein